MPLEMLQALVLITSLGMLFAQLFVAKKQTVHILFALFCGSMAMTVAQSMSVQVSSNLHYLFGLGACFTCNGYWLISRLLFRKENAITRTHVLIALSVTLIVVTRKGVMFIDETWQIAPAINVFITAFLTEMLTLFSSCMVALSFWEGCRNLSTLPSNEKRLRYVYLVAYATAAGGVMFLTDPIAALFELDNARGWTTSTAMLLMLVFTQWLIVYRQHQQNNHTSKSQNIPPIQTRYETTSDPIFIDSVNQKLVTEQLFLTPNLKVADLARALDVPEYRVSDAIKLHYDSANFNQVVNRLRIEHAKKLMTEESTQSWPVLVIGLESGFASSGPFNRAFKQFTGCTPNQFRRDNGINKSQ
jgi:AraC-like DNA-binding protein